jgi:hypothetical protein
VALVVLLAPLETQVHKAHKAQRVQLGHKVRKELWVHLAHKA